MNKKYLLQALSVIFIILFSFIIYNHHNNKSNDQKEQTEDFTYKQFFDFLLPISSNSEYFKEIENNKEILEEVINYKYHFLKDKILENSNLKMFFEQVKNYIKEKTNYEITYTDMHYLKMIIIKIINERIYYDDINSNCSDDSYKTCCSSDK